MKKRLFPLIIALSALSVAGSAAFYSVFGLSKLFAGAATQVIIMAGSLEFAKLVSASLLYQYWDTINKALKGYLMVAVFTLMLITSGGIYGFLSGAYQSTATQSELLDKSLVILEHKQVRFNETKEDLTLEKTQINKSISDLRISLSNPQQVSWYDKNSETVITSTSSSARRALQAELKTTIADRDKINLKLDAILDSITTTDMALLNKEISNEDERELGPLKYLSGITGWPMDKVVNWFLMLIIFVFDPLAIALVVAANFAFAQIKPKVKMSVPEGMEFNTPYPMYSSSQEPNELLIEKVKKNQEKLKPKVKVVEKEVIKEVPVEVEKIVEKIVEKEVIKEVPVEVEKIVKVKKKEEPILEGKQLAKGLETLLEVIEEEEKEKKKDKKVSDQSDEHEFYHKSNVTRRGNAKKRTQKKSTLGVKGNNKGKDKPPGWIKNWTNV